MKKTHLIAALLILQFGRTVSAQEMSFGSCQIFGQVFGIDPLGGDMLIKSPSGDIGGGPVDQTTVFEGGALNANPAGAARVKPPAIKKRGLCLAPGSRGDEVRRNAPP